MIEDDLEPLITKCPNCSTQFRVTESQLAVAAGRVRCGACLTVFEGTDHLLLDEEAKFFSSGTEADAALDELLHELDGSTADLDRASWNTGESTAEEPADDDLAPIAEEPRQLYGGFEDAAAAEDVASAEDVAGAEDDSEEAGDELDELVSPSVTDTDGESEPDDSWFDEDETSWAAGIESPAVADPDSVEAEMEHESTPDVARAEISFAREPRRWWVGVVAAIFVLALTTQILFLQLPSWSMDPGLRPGYEVACRWLGCELAEMRDLRKLQTRNLVVRSHPELSGALIVDVIIVNLAPFSQSFPDLNLSFTAVDGQLVANRRFTPPEYLAGELIGRKMMPSNTPIQVSLEIQDPGRSAVNYTLNFR